MINKAETPIGIGSVVQLRSGGDWMTVEDIVGETAKVVWMDAKKAVQREAFPLKLLINQDDWQPFV
jgi:uncharacterized protein YodC (DUF2158 family)